MEYPRDQYLFQSSLTFLLMTFLKLIHYQAEIATSTTIYADNVQLLFSGTPNNLEQLKIFCRDKPINNERMVQ